MRKVIVCLVQAIMLTAIFALFEYLMQKISPRPGPYTEISVIWSFFVGSLATMLTVKFGKE